MDTIIAKLNELSDVQSALAVARLDYDAKRAEILKLLQPERLGLRGLLCVKS